MIYIKSIYSPSNQNYCVKRKNCMIAILDLQAVEVLQDERPCWVSRSPREIYVSKTTFVPNLVIYTYMLCTLAAYVYNGIYCLLLANPLTSPKWIQWLSRDLLWPLYIYIYMHKRSVRGGEKKLITRNVVVPRASKK